MLDIGLRTPKFKTADCRVSVLLYIVSLGCFMSAYEDEVIAVALYVLDCVAAVCAVSVVCSNGKILYSAFGVVDINDLDGLCKTETKLAKLEKELHAELDKQKTQNCRKMGELIYERFGDDITPSEFEEMISFIFMNDEIREYIESEKKKRKAAEAAIVNDTEICDNAPDPLSPKNEKSKSVSIISDDDFSDSDDETNADDE